MAETKDNIVSLKEKIEENNSSSGELEDNFEVEFEVQPLIIESSANDEITKSISTIEGRQQILQKRIEALHTDIDRLTNHADGLDYTIAVVSGILCGVIDSFYVGSINYEETLKKVYDKFGNLVTEKSESIRIKETIEKAIQNKRAKGIKLTDEDIVQLRNKIAEGVKAKFQKVVDFDNENGTINVLRRAINKLEEHFQIPSDNIFKGLKGINPASHHLDDLAHHPTPFGLIAACLSVFIRTGVFVDKNGKWHIKFIKFTSEEGKEQWKQLVIPIIIAGLITWILNLVHSKYKDEIDKKWPKPLAKLVSLLVKCPLAITVLTSIVKVSQNWIGHLMSDMDGSSSTPGQGMGIPGFFVSILKEVSNIPPLNLTGLPKVIDEIYTRDRFDMRAESAVLSIAGKQAIPVVLGDTLVRGFYFIRHLILELRDKHDFKNVTWKNVIPFNNRTIVRMMTIESGTFTVCDIADAAIRTAIKNGTPQNPKFWSDLVLSVNFVGIGRFAIAVGTDVKMGVDRMHGRQELLMLQNKYLILENAKIFYKQEDEWIQAEEAVKSMTDLDKAAYEQVVFYITYYHQLEKNWANTIVRIPSIIGDDEEFKQNILDIL